MKCKPNIDDSYILLTIIGLLLKGTQSQSTAMGDSREDLVLIITVDSYAFIHITFHLHTLENISVIKIRSKNSSRVVYSPPAVQGIFLLELNSTRKGG